MVSKCRRKSVLLAKCFSHEHAYYLLCVQTFLYLLLLEANCICFLVTLMQLGVRLLYTEMGGAKMECVNRGESDRLSNCRILCSMSCELAKSLLCYSQ